MRKNKFYPNTNPKPNFNPKSNFNPNPNPSPSTNPYSFPLFLAKATGIVDLRTIMISKTYSGVTTTTVTSGKTTLKEQYYGYTFLTMYIVFSYCTACSPSFSTDSAACTPATI